MHDQRALADSGTRAAQQPAGSGRRSGAGTALVRGHYDRGMNPRRRRLVIPMALAGLILVVVIAAILR